MSLAVIFLDNCCSPGSSLTGNAEDDQESWRTKKRTHRVAYESYSSSQARLFRGLKTESPGVHLSRNKAFRRGDVAVPRAVLRGQQVMCTSTHRKPILANAITFPLHVRQGNQATGRILYSCLRRILRRRAAISRHRCRGKPFLCC